MLTRFRLQDFNPLLGLREGDIPRLVLDAMRGDLADFAWLIHWIIRSNYAVLACTKKLIDALAVMDWDIKTRPDLTPEQEVIAERQKQQLRADYDRIGNLKAACTHLALGEFYGWAHLNKIYAGGLPPADIRYKQGSWDVVELRPVEQWYWSRTGYNGAWLYNGQALAGYGQGIPINLRDWIIREVNPPLADVVARAHHKMETADDDWAQHDDTFAVPPIFLEGPPNASREQEDEFQDVAERIVSNGRGYIPNGAKVHTVTVPDGGDSFAGRMGKWESAIVLAVTRGKLTMLSDPQGIGPGSSGEHGKGWDDVAAALAHSVSECFQKQFDPLAIEKATPGQPALAWFEYAAATEEDVKAHCDNASTLNTAGYRINAEQLSEKTGYDLSDAPAPADASQVTTPKQEAPGSQPGGAAAVAPGADPSKAAASPAPVVAPPEVKPPIARPSRAGEAQPEIVTAAVANFAGLEERWLGPVKPILAEVEAALADPNKTPEEIEAILQRAHDALPALLPQLGIADLATALAEAGAPAAIQGTVDALASKAVKPAA